MDASLNWNTRDEHPGVVVEFTWDEALMLLEAMYEPAASGIGLLKRVAELIEMEVTGFEFGKND